MQSYPVEDYHIGIICALPKELKAVNAILNEEHQPLRSKDGKDCNSYVLGRVGKHNVVAAGLPAGVYGTTSAASVGKDMLRTFPQLRFGLLVGIAGGIPDIGANRDIRLGDVVVGQPDATHGGVVQYDLGKLLSDGTFARKGILDKPPQALLTALTNFQADLQGNDSIAQCLKEVDERYPRLREEGYCFQGVRQDVFYCARCDRLSRGWWWIFWFLIGWLWPFWQCKRCENGVMIRPIRSHTNPTIHYGTIASGNTLLKNATERDRLAAELGALCVEIEAAGLDNYPCLVIRGICDYADANKNDTWQEYAGLVAASFAKVLLEKISPESASKEKPIRQTLGQLYQHFEQQHKHHIKVEEHNQLQDNRYHDKRHRNCHRAFDVGDYERQKNINATAVPGTCRWVLDNPRYHEWVKSKNDLLWISADPGCGKSVLSRGLVDEWLTLATATPEIGTHQRPYSICYFFFKDNEEQSNLSTALCAVIHQLFSQQPELIRHALDAFNQNDKVNLTKKVDELWRIIQSIHIDKSAKPVICVLDALDECCDADRQLLLNKLCQWYENLKSRPQHQGCLKWLVTSRPHDDIQHYFGRLLSGLSSIHLRGEDENDQIRDEINLVIDERMIQLGRGYKLSDVKIKEVAQQLRKMDNRTYLWLYLVLEHIEIAFRKSPRPNQLKTPLLPTTVHQAYENILKRIVDAEDKEYAKVVLKIIVGARRPLTVAEMALAFDVATLPELPHSLDDLTVDAAELGQKIRSWCGLFVFIQHDRLYLIHQTAKEFLQSHDINQVLAPDTWMHCLSPLDIEKEMAKICVVFLCLSNFNTKLHNVATGQDGSGAESFFSFAAEHWADYVRMVEHSLDDQIQSRIQALYDDRTERFRRWTLIWRLRGRSGLVQMYDMIDIGVASYNGHCSAMHQILTRDPSKVNEGGSFDNTPLFWTAVGGHKEAMKLLLAQPGIDVNGGAALSEAARNGNNEIVELLLAQPDIDVNLEEPLCKAVEWEQTEIVKLLLAQPGIDVNGGAALSEAARNGNNEIVELLLAQPDIDVNLEEPLFKAVVWGQTEIVKLLLAQPDINVNLEGPLCMVGAYGYTEIVKLLLAQPGIDVNLGEPLCMAVEWGRKEIVKLLLAQPGIDVNLGEPLCEAVRYGYTEIVKLLLAQPDIDVNLGRPLNLAVRRAHKEIVEVLLAHPGIDHDLGLPVEEPAI